ncbi:TonB-dependent receptor plug domain-containing protein [Marinomonas sp.]|uniref:TonB-dependent receptor plug domain-containing protein n=1 Tax=Marinomonas sp. TaxID=1904862 RepID=UPI003A8FBA21
MALACSLKRRKNARTALSLLFANTLLAGGVGMMFSSVTYAEAAASETHYYNIPSGPLSKAINAFAAVSGMYLGGNSELLKSKNTQGFVGEYSAGQALDLLLIGTGLSYEAGEGRSIVLIDTESVSEGENGITMSMLLVQGRQNKVEAGVQVIGSEEIEAMPTEGGNLTDLLRTNTAVNFSRSSSSSTGSGSMRPDEVSIYGQDYYQNAFMIDGIDTSNDFDPGSSAAGDSYTNPISNANLSTLSGSSPQSYYMDIDALEQVKVYSSNIPVEYGGFMGGVIDARLRRYDGEDEVFIKYGLSKSEWEKFHFDKRKAEEFYGADSVSGAYTPEYKKQNYSITALKRLSDNVGSTLTISRKTSEFRQQYENRSDEVKSIYYDDTIDNMMARIDAKVNDRVDLGFSFRYSNRFHDGLTSKDYADTFVKSHTAYGVGNNFEYRFDNSVLTVDTAYDRSFDELDSESNVYTYHPTENFYNGLPYSGGYGDILQQQDTLSINTKWVRDAIVLGRTQHTFTLGTDLAFKKAFYEAKGSEFYSYTCSLLPSSGTGESAGCLDSNSDDIHDEKDEYLKTYGVLSANKLNKNYQSHAVYLQDKVEINNWTVTAGIRADHETLLDNINISPRASLQWNVFGDSRTTITTGTSRYYGRSFLKYAINDEMQSWYTSTQYNSDGSIKKGPTANSGKFANFADYDLNTPYSDEIMFRIDQVMGPVDTSLTLVNRESHDGVQRVKSKENKLYYYTNEGRSSNNSIELAFQQRTPFEVFNTLTKANFSIGWQESKSNAQGDDGYEETVEDEERVYYNGEVIDFADLPSWDYNIPFTVKLSTTTNIPAWHLKWSNFVNVKSGGVIAYRDTSSSYTDVDGNELQVYKDKNFDDLVTLDTKLRFSPPLWKDSEGYIELKVTNFFDQVMMITTSTSATAVQTFTSGRKISMEVGMRF